MTLHRSSPSRLSQAPRSQRAAPHARRKTSGAGRTRGGPRRASRYGYFALIRSDPPAEFPDIIPSREDLRRSDDELPAVLGRLDTELLEASEHVVSHVGQDEPAAAEPRAVRQQRRDVEVELDALVDEERLRDEEVGRARRIDQRLGPLRIPRVGDHLALAHE